MKYGLAFSLLANAILVGFLVWPHLHTKYEVCKPGLPIGAKLPEFFATTADGQKIEIAGSGGATVIAAWASWCEPCLAEMPGLSALFLKYRSEGLKVVGISLEPPPVAKAVLERIKPEYPQLYSDAASANGKVYFGPLPYVIVVDSQNRVVRTFMGSYPTTVSDIEAEVVKILKPPTGP